MAAVHVDRPSPEQIAREALDCVRDDLSPRELNILFIKTFAKVFFATFGILLASPVLLPVYGIAKLTHHRKIERAIANILKSPSTIIVKSYQQGSTHEKEAAQKAKQILDQRITKEHLDQFAHVQHFCTSLENLPPLGTNINTLLQSETVPALEAVRHIGHINSNACNALREMLSNPTSSTYAADELTAFLDNKDLYYMLHWLNGTDNPGAELAYGMDTALAYISLGTEDRPAAFFQQYQQHRSTTHTADTLPARKEFFLRNVAPPIVHPENRLIAETQVVRLINMMGPQCKTMTVPAEYLDHPTICVALTLRGFVRDATTPHKFTRA